MTVTHTEANDKTPLIRLIERAMAELAAIRPVFHSEADFQHAFAWQLRALDPETDVRLEVRLSSNTNERLDLLFHVGDDRFAVELKYPLAQASIEVDGEEFLLKNQGALDIMRFGYVWDIVRIERMVASGLATGGVAMILTNVSQLWSPPRQAGRVAADTAFRCHEGETMTGELGWQGDATWWRDKYPESVHLGGAYEMRWRAFSDPEGAGQTEFRWACAVCQLGSDLAPIEEPAPTSHTFLARDGDQGAPRDREPQPTAPESTPPAASSDGVFPSFRDFMEQAVLPHQHLAPSARRLDGWQSGGNWAVFGLFFHDGAVWAVHADTHFATLQLAHDEILRDANSDPFITTVVDTGRALDLRPDIRARYPQRFKHLYVYEVPVRKQRK